MSHFPHPTFAGIRSSPMCSRHALHSEPCILCETDLADQNWLFLLSVEAADQAGTASERFQVRIPSGTVRKEGSHLDCLTYLQEAGYVKKTGEPPRWLTLFHAGDRGGVEYWLRSYFRSLKFFAMPEIWPDRSFVQESVQEIPESKPDKNQ